MTPPLATTLSIPNGVTFVRLCRSPEDNLLFQSQRLGIHVFHPRNITRLRGYSNRLSRRHGYQKRITLAGPNPRLQAYLKR